MIYQRGITDMTLSSCYIKYNHGYELRNFRNYNLLSKQIAELSDVKMYISGYILMNKKYAQYNTLHVG